jgi:hypothetical protein
MRALLLYLDLEWEAERIVKSIMKSLSAEAMQDE